MISKLKYLAIAFIATFSYNTPSIGADTVASPDGKIIVNFGI